jgi:hypothetical protein
MTLLAFNADRWEDSEALETSRLVFEAATTAVNYEHGVNPTAAIAMRSHFDEQIKNWTEAVESVQSSARDWEAEFSKLHDKVHNEADGMLAEKRQSLKEFRDLHAQEISETKAHLQAMKDVYEQHMALSAPVEYWNTRATSMFWRMILTGGVLIVGFIVLACVLYANFPTLKANEPKAEHRLWELALLLGTVGILAWPLRIVAKIFMSAVHLEADALEKRTMVLSYLAMLKENAVTEKQRDIVLASVFRPSTTGIVNDDGLQVGFVETMAKSVAGK